MPDVVGKCDRVLAFLANGNARVEFAVSADSLRSAALATERQPGGLWRFVMHGPHGADYENESVFVEIVKPERIVFRHLKPVHEFQMTMTFIEQEGKTKLTWRMLFTSAAECDKVKAYAVEANEQNFDRLEAQLARMA